MAKSKISSSSTDGEPSGVTHLFQPSASLLPLLHAAKWPSNIVIGCLLGTLSDVRPAQGSSSNSSLVNGRGSRTDTSIPQAQTSPSDQSKPATSITARYTHAIPLLHHWTGLSMAFESGMDMVEEYAALNSLHVLGFYYAPAGLPTDCRSDEATPIVIKRLNERLSGPVADASASSKWTPRIFVLDNRNLSTQSAFQLLSTSQPKTESISYLRNASHDASPTRLPRLLKAGAHAKVEDWDDHLEDIGARWLKNEAVDLSIDTIET